MKVRLGVTVPLRLEAENEAVLDWPCFLERNFKFAGKLKHTVWLQSPQAASISKSLRVEEMRSGAHSINGQLSDDALSRGDAVVRLRRDPSVRTVVTPEITSVNGVEVVQNIDDIPARTPPRVVVVVDGSVVLRKFSDEIAGTLASLPEMSEVRLLLGRDDLGEAPPVSGAKAAAAYLRRFPYSGGHDNVAALTRAWELACEKPGGVLLWIHGPQPVVLESVQALRQSMEWRGDSGDAGIFELCVTAGPDRVAEKLDGLASFQTLPREGGPTERLRRLFSQWQSDAPIVRATRSIATRSAKAGTREASKHIARLWAKEEIGRLVVSRKTAEAVALAGAYQLVTPVSGAVVLENAAQYKQNELNPADPTTVPTVPEPGMIVLFAAGFVLCAVFGLVRRKLEGKPPATSP